MTDKLEPKVKVKPRLIKILRERKITQMQLSKKSGVPQGSISRFDSRTKHEANHLFSIARALDIDIDDLFEIVDE